MTDSEKLDLLLSKMDSIDTRLNSLEAQTNDIRKQLMKSTAELKAMDSLIFDEVERVHGILDRHKEDKVVHTA